MDQLIKFPKLQLECGNLLTMLNGQSKLGIVDNLMDHFEFVKQFPYEGAQGKVGILKHKKTGELVIYKTSLKVDYGIRHENFIFETLRGIRQWCPNFSEGYGMVKTPVSYSDTRKHDPFTKEEGAKVYMDVLLSEYIPGSKGLTERISSFSTRRLFSVIRQILTAIELGYRKYGLVHYDLHSDNILVVECPENAIFLYNLGDRQVCVPTHGVVPVIIDYGYSFVKGSKAPIYMNMGFTDAGYLACVADPFYDARIFLINVADEMNTKDSHKYGKFYADVKETYKGLSYHPTKGWDDYGQYSAAEMVQYTIEELEKKYHISEEINNFSSTYTQMFQSLVCLPLTDKKNGNFRPFYLNVAREFSKFEGTVRTSFSRKFLMHNIIDVARKHRQLYYTNKEDALRQFRRDLSEQIALSFKFYSPPADAEYDVLLGNLYDMADCIETIYFRVMQKAITERKERYAKTLLRKNMDIHDLIEAKYTTEYFLEEDSLVYVWDSVAETNTVVTNFTKEECAQFNALTATKRAKWLWERVNSRDNVLV